MALTDKRLFLLDMDGTLYLDEQLFNKVPEFLSFIRQQGGRYLFLTNNSSRGVEGYIEKMRRLGIETTAEDYLTSADAAEHTLLTEFPGQQCYVSGTASLKAQLTGAGIQVSDTLSDDITVLLSGFDTELTFQKLEDSCILLNRGVTWLATNPDWVCPPGTVRCRTAAACARCWSGPPGKRPAFWESPGRRWCVWPLPGRAFRRNRLSSSATGCIPTWPAASTPGSTVSSSSAARALWVTS